MTRAKYAELLDTIAGLEGENADLRKALGLADSPTTPAGLGLRQPHPRNWGWTMLAAAFMAIGAMLAPAATIASWARVQLTDADSFVATYAPLAGNAGVQDFVTDQAVAAIEQSVDIPGLTADVFDGIADLGTGPAATRALEALKGPAAQGVLSLVHSTVASFVASDAFAQVWQEALRLSHSHIIATLQNDPEAAVALGSDGSVGIQLGPIIERVKAVLLERGMTFAAQIPAIDRTITVAQNSQLPSLQLFYGLALGAGAWLPWIVLLFLAAGVVVARHRALALVWAAVALSLAMVVVVAGIAIGRTVFIASVSPSLIPSGVAQTMFNTVTGAMSATGVAVLVLALVVASLAWFSGPFEIPRNFRSLLLSGAAWVRVNAEGHGVSTGRTGEWVHARRTLFRAAVAVVAAAIVSLVRPLTVSLIGWTLATSPLLIVAMELVQRPPGASSSGGMGKTERPAPVSTIE